MEKEIVREKEIERETETTDRIFAWKAIEGDKVSIWGRGEHIRHFWNVQMKREIIIIIKKRKRDRDGGWGCRWESDFFFRSSGKFFFRGQREIFSSSVIIKKKKEKWSKAIENTHTKKTWSLIKTTTNNASTSLCTHSKDWRHDYFCPVSSFLFFFLLCYCLPAKEFQRFRREVGGPEREREKKNKWQTPSSRSSPKIALR